MSEVRIYALSLLHAQMRGAAQHLGNMGNRTAYLLRQSHPYTTAALRPGADHAAKVGFIVTILEYVFLHIINLIYSTIS